MAIWRVANAREGLKVLYEHPNQPLFEAGLVRFDTPVPMLLDWIITQKATSTWDLIELPGGRVLQILPTARGRQ